MAGRRLQFDWSTSPGVWCVFSKALDHAHSITSHRSAVCTDSGGAMTSAAQIHSCGAATGLRRHSWAGGGDGDEFLFVRYYVDGGASIDVQPYSTANRCLFASASLASDHVQLFSDRAPTAPALLSKQNTYHSDIQLKLMGWEVYSVTMDISLTDATWPS